MSDSSNSKPVKVLLTGVFGPYGMTDEWAEGLGMQMELLNNQITRGQGIHSPRQMYWTGALYILAENISVPSTVLDFPTWNDFVKELKKGYTHVGINFILPNVMKAKRMAEHVRKEYPEMKIILGGYGAVIPDIANIVPYDELCTGEGVTWMRSYFHDNVDAPIKHPVLRNPIFLKIYGMTAHPRASVLYPGVGCENGCDFCATSHKFGKKYISLLQTGQSVFDACRNAHVAFHATGFTILDENFLKKPERAKELLACMERENQPYVFEIFSSAEVVTQLGIDFLVRLGIKMVWIGVESKTSIYGKLKNIDVKSLIARLQDAGISVNTSSILFLEHHTKETIQEDIDWVIGLGADTNQFMNYTPLPGTAFYLKCKEEGRLKEHIPYNKVTGVKELWQKHPSMNDPKDHNKLLKQAFKQKYLVGGPGILNMMLTSIKGYMKAEKDYQGREAQGYNWNPATLKYEKSENPRHDEFMRLRVEKLKKIAINTRPLLLTTRLFSPNRAARVKAKMTQQLYKEALGEQFAKDRFRSRMLVFFALGEQLRLLWWKLKGHETIVMQPPSRTMEFGGNQGIRSKLSPDAAMKSEQVSATLHELSEVE
jgi:hypothetical protein